MNHLTLNQKIDAWGKVSLFAILCLIGVSWSSGPLFVTFWAAMGITFLLSSIIMGVLILRGH